MLKSAFFTILLLGLLSSPVYANLPIPPEPTPRSGTIPPATATPAPMSSTFCYYFPLVAQNGAPLVANDAYAKRPHTLNRL